MNLFENDDLFQMYNYTYDYHLIVGLLFESF